MGRRLSRQPVSDHCDGRRFFNPGGGGLRGFRTFLRWRLHRKPGPWPEWVENAHRDVPPQRVPGAELRLSFVNHATFLIQTRGLNILTDPVWSRRASPFSWAGPKRARAPGIAFDDLPPIDLVLVSHGHYDHLDAATLRKLWERDRPRIVAPLGQDKAIGLDTTTLDWGDSVALGDVSVTAEPARHWSSRGLFDANRALWCAFVLRTSQGAIYFAGDTGYGPHFRTAAEKYGGFRLALLPIGSYEPRWFMAFQHMNPEEAVRAHLDLRAERSVGFHFGTFHLADDGYDQPLADLAAARERYQVSAEIFRTLENGEAIQLMP